MKKALSIILLLPLLVFWQPSAHANKADYKRGLEAIQAEDYKKAYEIFFPLAEQGYKYAQHSLGVIHENGQGVTKNYKEAVRWYRLAAEQGLKQSQTNLGKMYNDGLGVTKNTKEAIKWYSLAAAQGFAEAQHNIGVVYHDGRDIPQDTKEAIKWFRLAAEQGLADSQNNLAVIYYTDKALQNYEEALKWFRLSAEQGDDSAQHNLGVMHLVGHGVSLNYIHAYMWFSIAEANGHHKSKEILEALEEELTASQLEKAQTLAVRCYQSDYRDCEG